jgi:hypothetical protein
MDMKMKQELKRINDKLNNLDTKIDERAKDSSL